MQRNDFIRQANVIASEISLPANTDPVWHWHSVLEESIYCLSGILSVQSDSQGKCILTPGEKAVFPAGSRHAIGNQQDEAASYLLVQQGDYDFNHCEPPQ